MSPKQVVLMNKMQEYSVFKVTSNSDLFFDHKTCSQNKRKEKNSRK
jgi:hypothetical protein